MSLATFTSIFEIIPQPWLVPDDPNVWPMAAPEVPDVMNVDDDEAKDDDAKDDDDDGDDDDLDHFDVEKEVTLDEGFSEFDENDFDDDFDDDFEQDIEDDEFGSGEAFELDD